MSGQNALLVPLADAQLSSVLRDGEKLVARATSYGLAFALDDLGDIEIPGTTIGQVDQAQLRALATLYLAAELEPAGVIPAAEMLAGLAGSGALSIDLGPMQPLIASFWERRKLRITPPERNAFYSRLFGTAGGPVSADADKNYRFEDLMLALCEALYRLDEKSLSGAESGVAQQARVRVSANALIQNLVSTSGGITAFLANEIVTALREAFAIVGHSHLRGLFSARDIWGVVAAIARLGGQSIAQPSLYVRRGKAGMMVLSWLADISLRLDSPQTLAQPSDPAVAAAFDWMQATLEVGEQATRSMPFGPNQTNHSNMSPWAALGA